MRIFRIYNTLSRRKNMNKWSYTKGLHDLGNSIYAYLQPDGSWGWSNAGIITDGDASLLIDTLFDTLVYIPSDRVIFTGDILFIGGHPIIWAGPTSNWIRACDLILSLDVETIVPGHGPITDKQGVSNLKAYFEYIFDEARRRY